MCSLQGIILRGEGTARCCLRVWTLETSGPGDATQLVRQKLREYADPQFQPAASLVVMVAVGGDGTINEVANGFFHPVVDLLGPPEEVFCPFACSGSVLRILSTICFCLFPATPSTAWASHLQSICHGVLQLWSVVDACPVSLVGRCLRKGDSLALCLSPPSPSTIFSSCLGDDTLSALIRHW